MLIKVFKWFFLSFLISLLPFGASIASLVIHNIPLRGYAGVTAFWEHGELCLISITLVAAGIGDVASSNMQQLKAIKILVILCCVLFLLATMDFYTEISSCLVTKQPYNVELTRQGTPLLLIFSAITGLACVLLSKE